MVTNSFLFIISKCFRKIIDMSGNSKQANYQMFENTARFFDWTICRIFSIKTYSN